MAIENFVAYNPTKLHFGKNVVETLGETVKQYGKRVLLVYGKGSVKKYGTYDLVVEQLTGAGLEIVEYGGIQPNPLVGDVRKAVTLGKEKNIDVIVALGGGSVIDSCKIMGLSLANDIDPWQFMTWQAHPKKSIPLVTVLTLAATGTEMNGAAVLQNPETGQKVGYVNPLSYPKDSFLDPQFTATVPKDYTAFGITDLIAHALEAFYGAGEPSVTDRITLSIILDAMEKAPLLMADLSNYDLRAAIMLDATLALNGLTSYGKTSGDWGVHALGHELSLLYGTAHGASLSIVYPAWLKLQKSRIPERIKKMTQGLFGTDDIDKGIALLEAFFTSIGSPIRLSEAGINASKKDEILAQMNKNQDSGMHHALNNADRALILEKMIEG
jgi:alcohol dehydrogenase YqhD (iron-dependent ADH family)